MRKTIVIIILVLLSIGVFYSCSKKDDKTNINAATNIQATINQEDFLKYLAEQKPTNIRKTAPYWATVVGADVFGGCAVVGALGYFNIACPYCGGAGFFAGAALGSLAVGIPCPLCPKNNPYAQLTPYNPNTKPDIFSNPSNPYDFVGVMHNQVMYNVTSNPTIYISSQTNSLNYNLVIQEIASTYASNQNVTSDYFFSIVPSQKLNNYVTTLNASSAPYNTLVLGLYNSGQIDNFVYTTMTDYYSTITSYTNYQDIYKYSIGVENKLSLTNANTQDKQLLFSVLSIGRYSAGYWINSLPH